MNDFVLEQLYGEVLAIKTDPVKLTELVTDLLDLMAIEPEISTDDYYEVLERVDAQVTASLGARP